VTVGEHAQERPQGRRGAHPAEQQRHAAMAHHIQVVDRIRPGEHARHDRGDLALGTGSLVRRHMQPLTDDAVQVARIGKPHHRLQPGARHQVRIIKRCDAHPRAGTARGTSTPSDRRPPPRVRHTPAATTMQITTNQPNPAGPGQWQHLELFLQWCHGTSRPYVGRRRTLLLGCHGNG